MLSSQNYFPMAFIEFEYNGRTLHIDRMLADILKSCVYNAQYDFDFVVVISGNRDVRVGKSVMAMQMAAYTAYCLEKLGLNKNAFNIENIFFDHRDMLKEAVTRPKYSVVLYDEAREGLASQKASTQFQQDLIQYFNECGQLRNFYFLCLPDFFDLREYMAVARAYCLVNVYMREELLETDLIGLGKTNIIKMKRGFFQFYNKKAKNLMFDIFRTTRKKDYSFVKPSFPVGQFMNEYAVDEEQYRKMKADALARFKTSEEKNEATEKPNYHKVVEEKYKLVEILLEEHKNDYGKVSSLTGLNEESLRKIKQRNKSKKKSEPA